MSENETGKMMALMLVLMNVLILTAIGGVFLLIQTVIDQANELSALIYTIKM